MIKELVTKTEVRVRFNETDPLGIVWHGHYIRYFEDVATGNSVQVFLNKEDPSLQLLNPPFFEEWKRKNLSS